MFDPPPDSLALGSFHRAHSSATPKRLQALRASFSAKPGTPTRLARSNPLLEGILGIQHNSSGQHFTMYVHVRDNRLEINGMK